MESQHTFFYGRKQGHTPRKDGENPSVPERRFRAPTADAFQVRFSNRTVTQVGGYPLWHTFCYRIGLKQGLSRAVRIHRGRVAFTASELARFLIDGKVLGMKRLMHAETLRLGPLLCQCAGIDGLPSGKTLGVFLKEHTERHLEGIENLTVAYTRRLWAKRRRKRPKLDRDRMDRLVIDYDSATMTVYGKQEGADRGRSLRKKDKPGFQPRFAFVGGLGITLHQELLPQSHNLNKDFIRFHEETLRRLLKRARVWAIRGDAALFSEAHIEYFEARKLTYAIGAPINGPLRDAIDAIPESAWQEGQNQEGHPVSIARIQYCPRSWKKKERTFIIRARLRPNPTGQLFLFESERYRYFAYITNHCGSLPYRVGSPSSGAPSRPTSRNTNAGSTTTSCRVPNSSPAKPTSPSSLRPGTCRSSSDSSRHPRRSRGERSRPSGTAFSASAATSSEWASAGLSRLLSSGRIARSSSP